MAVDELKLLTGDSCEIDSRIFIRHPELGEIRDFGERKYFSIISNLVAIPSDMMSILDDIGIDFEEISEFELFIYLTKTMSPNDTKIILKDINLQGMEVFSNKENGDPYLSESSSFMDEITILEREKLDKFITDIFGEEFKYKALSLIQKYKNHEVSIEIFKKFFDPEIFEMKCPKTDGLTIDMRRYLLIADYIRRMHGLKYNPQKAGNKGTKQVMIDLDRSDREESKKSEYKSILAPLIVALVNCADFKYNFHDVWRLPITTFMESAKQIQRLKNFNFTMSGIYAGTVDFKKISKKELNWI